MVNSERPPRTAGDNWQGCLGRAALSRSPDDRKKPHGGFNLSCGVEFRVRGQQLICGRECGRLRCHFGRRAFLAGRRMRPG